MRAPVPSSRVGRARGRVLGSLALCGAVVGGTSALAGSAHAEPAGTVVVAIDCPALMPESRAALEARARAELIARRESGTLVVQCGSGVSHVTWDPSTGVVEATLPMAADAGAFADDVLGALEGLLTSGDAAVAHEAPTVPVAPAAPAEPTRVPDAPRRAPAVAPPEPGTPPSSVARARHSEATPRRAAIAVAAGLELWSSPVFGAAGPEARGVLSVVPGVALSAGGALLWTLRAPESVAARVVRPLLGVDASFAKHGRVRVGVDVLLDVLQAYPVGALPTEPVSDARPAARFRAAYALSAGPFDVVLGPTLGLRAGPTRVEFGDHEVFRVPPVVFGVNAGLEWPGS